jgi:hypothetical protein
LLTETEHEETLIHQVLPAGSEHGCGDWTAEDFRLLFRLFGVWGSKWTRIAQEMGGKYHLSDSEPKTQ